MPTWPQNAVKPGANLSKCRAAGSFCRYMGGGAADWEDSVHPVFWASCTEGCAGTDVRVSSTHCISLSTHDIIDPVMGSHGFINCDQYQEVNGMKCHQLLDSPNDGKLMPRKIDPGVLRRPAF